MKLKGKDIVELGLTIRFDSCPIFPFEYVDFFYSNMGVTKIIFSWWNINF
jgi:hypothetical protein